MCLSCSLRVVRHGAVAPAARGLDDEHIARRDLGRAKNIQDARGETLFSRYIIEADKILRDAGW